MSDMDGSSGSSESGCDNVDPFAVFIAEKVERYNKLPADIKKRCSAVKKILVDQLALEREFYMEMHKLECKYNKNVYPLYTKRHEIVTGIYEPTEEDCKWNADGVDEDLSKEFKDKANINDNNVPATGIPEFWLTVFKNSEMLKDTVFESDEPILKHLIDIKTILLEDPMGFVLEFHFSPNEYFSNSVLTKEYELSCVIDKANPLSFEGPEIISSKGCVIDWMKGKNVTVREVKKKSKNKANKKVITKKEKTDSFFNFFSPPSVLAGDVNSEIEEELQDDYEIGHYFREKIIPQAILYFTGEIDEMDSDFEEGGEEEDGDEEEDDDDDDDDDNEGEARKPSGGHHSRSKKYKKSVGDDGKNPECKQQ